jgi:hypothetical protein
MRQPSPTPTIPRTSPEIADALKTLKSSSAGTGAWGSKKVSAMKPEVIAKINEKS